MLKRRAKPPLRPALRALAAVGLALLQAAAQAQDEVPLAVTPDRVTQAMLELVSVTVGDYVIGLGWGDGRIVIPAVQRFGARELDVGPAQDLVTLSRENARKAGVAERAEFRVQDLFETPLAGAQVVTMDLLPEVNLQLRPRCWRWRWARASSATTGTWVNGRPTAA